MEELDAISPIDGRYRSKTEKVALYFSERALIIQRVRIELEYLKALTRRLGKPFSQAQTDLLTKIYQSVVENDDEIHLIKEIDRKIRHDVKAIEYYLRNKFLGTELEPFSEFLHFGLTSTDIDNLALTINFRDFVNDTLIPAIDALKKILYNFARNWKSIPMLGRTHGQPAVPTTLGKEIANFVWRLGRMQDELKRARFYGKLNGAVGNFNAHVASFPEIDWIAFSEEFIRSLALEPIVISTQIPPHENFIKILDEIRIINSILSGLSQDIWLYLSYGYLKLRAVSAEVGSSTMPQKVNPIDFEMAESCFSSANALLENMARRLAINRLQRDLTDKYTLRDLGTAMAYSYLGIEALKTGLEKIIPDEAKMHQDLEAHWEVIGEGIQTILRASGYPNAYDLLKEKTRGKKITKEEIAQFIEELDVPEEIKTRLRQLSPVSYLGKAIELTQKALEENKNSPAG